MAKQNYDDSEGVWRTVGGRRIFIKNGQALSTAMKESGKFKKEPRSVEKVKDVTEEWKKNAKPKEGEIEVSEYTVSKTGERFDEKNAKLKKALDKDIAVGTWFKNTIWGDTVLQRGVDFPLNKQSADLLLLNNCPFLKEQTVEIKSIPNTKRVDGVATAIKSGSGQSSNILLDMSGASISKEDVISEAENYMGRQNWVQVIVIKKDDDIVTVLSK